MNTDIYISLGTNLGNKLNNLSTAHAMIEKHCGLIEQKSSIYESPPWGYTSFNNYLNQVIKIQTNLQPIELLRALLKIEKKMGRTRNKNTYQDRPIDLDIIYYGKLVINSTELTIPHPHIYNRNFILVPLNEIAPKFRDPNLKETVSSLIMKSRDSVTVSLYE